MNYIEQIQGFIPTVEGNGDYKSYDLYSRLLKERIVQLDTEVNSNSAALVRNQLLFLDSQGHKDIHLYINSPGGSVISGLGIVDTMNFIKSNVAVYCVGVAASMAAVIFSAGAKGKRFVSVNSEIMIHQPSGGIRGKADEIINYTNHMKRLEEKVYGIIANNCGKTYEEVKAASTLDNFLSAEEAIKFGIADNILGGDK